MIRNAIGRYFHLLDDRTFDEWKTLLTDDVKITVNDVDRWPADIQMMGQRGQHIAVNHVIEVDGDTAVAVFDYFYIGEIGPAGFQRNMVFNFGRYTDKLRKENGRWLIAEVAMKVAHDDHFRR